MAIATAMTTRCPRCEAPITGDFKYCPECAFRLKAGPAPEPEQAAPRWPHLLVLTGFVGLIVLFVVLGLWIFDMLGTDDRDPRGTGFRRIPMADILSQMQPLESRIAEWVEPKDPNEEPEQPVDEDEPLDEPETEAAEDPVPHFDPVAVRTRRLRMMRFEVTNGQYAEFLSALDQGSKLPKNVQDWLTTLFEPGTEGERTYTAAYVAAWWVALVKHLEEKTGSAPPIPGDLPMTVEALESSSIPAKYRTLLFAPPHWIHIENGAFTWRLPDGKENYPATGMAFTDAQTFASWAGDLLGVALRLPTLAEFKRAAHQGRPYRTAQDPGWKWPWGNEFNPYFCNSLNFYPEGETPALRRVNERYVWGRGVTEEGVYGLAGNAREWVRNGAYEWVLTPDPTEDDPDRKRVEYYWSHPGDPGEHSWAPTAGGSYLMGLDECKAEDSKAELKTSRQIDVGFRLVYEPII